MILSSTMFHGGALIEPATGVRFQAMAMGYTHSAMINASNQVYTSGNQSNGKLGNGATTNTVAWTKQFVTLPKGAIQVDASVSGTTVLLNDNTVRYFGGGGAGIRGDGLTSDASTPITPDNADAVAQVALGRLAHFMLKKTGKLFSSGQSGQNGHGSLVSTMTEIPDLDGVVIAQVSAGWDHAAAIDIDGNLWTWGSDTYGQIGRTPSGDQYVPVKVSGMTGCLKVACGSRNTYVIKTDGTLWSVGQSAGGANGNGTITPNLTTFAQASGVSGATDVAAGEYFGLVVTSSGVLSWGEGSSGQLVDGQTSLTGYYKSTASATTGPVGTPQFVSAGKYQSMAANTVGGIYAGGYGDNGQFATTSSPGTITDLNTAAYTGETVLTP